MKKLSIFLAILILLISILVITSVLLLKVEAASLSKPAEWNWEANPVSENDAIGYIENGNADIWVDTLTHAADVARANGGTQVVLYLEKDYTTTKRIGVHDDGNLNNAAYDTLYLTENANLVIDGKNHSMRTSNAGRFLHFGTGDGTGQITFRNITIGTLADSSGNHPLGSLQTNLTSLKKITFKNVTIDFPNPNLVNNAMVIGTNIELDGVTRNCAGADFIYAFQNDISITIKNSTISNTRNVIHGHNQTYNDININNVNVTNGATNLIYNAKVENININSLNVTTSITDIINNVTADNININGLNVTSCTRLFNTVTSDIMIYDANVTSTNSIISSYSGDMVINGGSFTTTNDRVIYFNAADSSTLTINNGTFTAQRSTREVIYQSENSGNKVTTINGGVFNSWNKTATPNNTTIPKDSTAAVTVYGILYSSADTFQVNGGIFNLYQDSGTNYASVGVHALTRGSGYISINGGTFNGGTYVNIKALNEFDAANAKKFAMPTAGGTYTIANSLTTLKGASIRTNATTPGIRFQGIVSDEVINYVKEFSGTTNVYSGILIVPAIYLETTNGLFTISALEDNSLTWATKNNATKISNGDGTYKVRLALTGIKNANLSNQYVAITYVYGDLTGNGLDSSDIIVYAEAPSEPRSIVETAKAALADVMTTSGTYGGRNYTNAVTGYYYKRTASGTFVKISSGAMPYTPYTAAQITEIKKYA